MFSISRLLCWTKIGQKNCLNILVSIQHHFQSQSINNNNNNNVIFVICLDSAIEEHPDDKNDVLYRGLRVRMGVHCGEPRAERVRF